MTPKTLPREPYRGGQICGYQTEYGVVPGRSVYCGENKAPNLPACAKHFDDLSDGGVTDVTFAPGNATGIEIHDRPDGYCVVHEDGSPRYFSHSLDALKKLVGIGLLQWEGEGGEPIDATPGEQAQYDGRVPRDFTCLLCHKIVQVWLDPDDLHKYRAGKGSIQELMPYLAVAERELFLTGWCDSCFNVATPEDDE